MRCKYKIAIFDLDLTLWDGENIFKDTKRILKYCKRKNIKPYIVSYNEDPESVCRHLDIHKYILEYFFDRTKPKINMIREILDKEGNQDIKEEEVAFFDDIEDNFILEGSTHQIKTKLVNSQNGLNFRDFISFLYKIF